MNFDFLHNDLFLQARNTKKSHFFGSIDIPLLSWDTILDELEAHITGGLDYESKNNLRFILFEMRNQTIARFVEQYSKLDPTLHCGAHGYVNLMSKSGENGRHKDPADVLFWQVVGTTRWTIEDDTTKTYILEPGTAVYVPTGMYHSVTSLSPRAGISFGLDYE
jgi:ribosomal protein L16 Arg81 hydroxylase